jgi:uncharacterized CHY-type Zn-finger protein
VKSKTNQMLIACMVCSKELRKKEYEHSKRVTSKSMQIIRKYGVYKIGSSYKITQEK